MKKRETLLACLFFMMVFGKLNAANGGPDAFGYTWKDSNEPGGPIPIWLDTNANSIRVLNLGDDNSVGMFDMVWNFRYYLGTYHSFKIGSNGWVSFDNIGNIAHCFPTIPTPGGAGDNYLAPFMSDLTWITSSPAFPNSSKCYYWTNNQDSTVISFYNVPFYQQSSPAWIGSNTFQILLDGIDHSITYTYQNMNPTFITTIGCQTDLSIGIESTTGTTGLECWRGIMPSSNYAIKFKYPTFNVEVEVDSMVCGTKDSSGFRHYSYLLTTTNPSNTPGLSLQVRSQDGVILSPSTYSVQNGSQQVWGSAKTLLGGNRPFFFDIIVIDTMLNDTTLFSQGILLPNCDSNVCDGSLFRNGTFSVGNTAGALGSGGQLSFWGNGYGTPLVSSGQGYDDLGMVRLRGNKLQGDAVSQTLDPNRKIIQGKTYTFSGSARLEQGALLANHVKLGVIAYNGSLPSGPGHPIPSSSIALIGYLGKLNSLQWTTSELAPWKANKNFDKVAIYAINNYDNTLSSVWIDDLCMVEVPDTCDCWGIALDSIGNPIIPAPYDQYVDPNTSSVYDTLDYFKGYTTDLYGTGAAIDTISFDTCCVSIGGTVPEAALEMDFDDSLTAMGIFISADSMDKILKFVGDSTLNAKLGLLNPWSGLPRLDTFCCPPPFAALDSMSPFQGKDIVFVHGLEQGAIWEKITNNTGHEQTTWPADAKEFYNNYNGNGYYGRWKEDADEYWQAHIAHFLRGKGYKNRYLTIAWPSTQGLHVASHSMLAQISEAMINGQGVELLDPNDPRGTVGFGGQGYVIISHSTGGLVSDVAMSVANMTKTDLPLRQTLGPVGYISDAANVHVGVQAAFSGSNFATLAVAVFTRFPLLAPLLNIVANIDALSIQNIIGSFTAVQTSVLVDLIPQVTQLYWMNRYGRHTPVPVLTVAGGHPDRNFTLAVKGLLHKGFDDGVLSMDCQCGNNNFNPISTPSAYAPKPWPFHANVFDMGIGVESAIDYYVAQILESGSSFASAGCIAKLSPTGMVQPILWVPGWRNPHHRYTNHYSFIQSSSDNNSGPKGTTTNWPYFNDPYVFPYNYDPTIVLGETRNEEVRVITDNSVYSQNLVSDGIKSQVQEQIKGLKWTITFKFFGKKFSKSFWIWKRVYNRLEDFEVMTVMDYVYKYVCRP